MSVTRGPKVPIGKILLDQGKITPDQLKQALAMQKTTTEKLGRLLIDLQFCSERDVNRAYAQQLNIQLYDAARITADPAVARIIPDNLVQRYNIVPLRRNGGKLVVAMVDPTNVFALDDIRMITNLDIEPLLATMDELTTLRRASSSTASAPAPAAAAAPNVPATAPAKPATTGGFSFRPKPPELKGKAPAPASADSTPATSSADINAMLESMRKPDDGKGDSGDESIEVSDDAPIIRMVNVLIQNAIKEAASDIHVEPDRKNVRIRYRIDGVLYEMMTLPRFAQQPLLSRLKIMSEMNIAERRVPQDGRMHIRHDKRDYDMRVNVLPTVFGEKCVMRILDQSQVLIGMGRLGFMPDMLAELEELIELPNGMVLVTGPTGSGKTTTLYSMLNKINSVDKNIVTIEDPVEYQLPGINQVIVNRKSGLTFPVAMRSFLRQDPDIIMVGEIRDLETAEIAVQASLTGHLVLSTLHTNNAPATMVRLGDMGVEPFLIAAAIVGVVAQRLGRRLCDKCKEPIEPPVEALMRLGMKEEEMHDATFFKGVGCPDCNNRGFRGRIGIYELLTITEELSEMIIRRAPVSEVTQAAIAAGMTTLMRDGLDKVKRGMTTIEEILRVISIK